jgi:hypothetical protein
MPEGSRSILAATYLVFSNLRGNISKWATIASSFIVSKSPEVITSVRHDSTLLNICIQHRISQRQKRSPTNWALRHEDVVLPSTLAGGEWPVPHSSAVTSLDGKLGGPRAVLMIWEGTSSLPYRNSNPNPSILMTFVFVGFGLVSKRISHQIELASYKIRCRSKKAKAIPVTGRGGLQGCEMLRTPPTL